MQKKLLFLVQLVLSMSLCLPARVMAQSGNTVLQPQFGKQTVTVETGQEITFYDPKGTDYIPSSSSSNAQSLLVFKPAQEGMSIQITFEQFELIGSARAGSLLLCWMPFLSIFALICGLLCIVFLNNDVPLPSPFVRPSVQMGVAGDWYN